MFPGPWVWKDLNKEKCQKNWKKFHVLSKDAKIRDVDMWNHSITTRNYAVTYYKTPRGGSLTPGADKNQK